MLSCVLFIRLMVYSQINSSYSIEKMVTIDPVIIPIILSLAAHTIKLLVCITSVFLVTILSTATGESKYFSRIIVQLN